MLNVEIESTKINILSSQLLIFPCVSTDYMLVLYIIAEAEGKWIPTFKEVLTNRKKDPLKMLTRTQLLSKTLALYNVSPFKTLPRLNTV